jgi:hypothetical protein
MQIFDAVTECTLVPDSGNLRISFSSASGAHTIELTQAAVAALMPGLLAQPRVAGAPTTTANAISPTGCMPFESLQGLCGLAFDLAGRSLHVAVPPSGIEAIRKSLDLIETAYRNQQMPRMPG